MKTFKEWIKQDRDTFFNDSEFADKLIINNIEVVVLNYIKQEKRSKAHMDYMYENHEKVAEEFSIKTEDYSLIGSPSQGEKILMNESYYEILEINKNDETCNMKVQVYR